MPVLPAARRTDEVTHGLEMIGMVAGSILGAVVGAAILFAEGTAVVATEGAALLALPAALGAAGMAVSGGGLAGGQLARGLETVFGGPWKTGVIESGSPNVLIGRLPAARTVVDAAANCGGLHGLYHFALPHVAIAEGAKKTLINNQNAARVTMKLACGGEIKSGFDRVLIGGPTARVLPVAYDEAAFRSFLGGMFEGSFYLTLVGSALLGPEAVALFLGTYGACYLGFELLGELGDALGPGWRDVLQGGFGVLLTALPLLRPGEAVVEERKTPISKARKTAVEEIRELPELKGKTKAEIEAELTARGYTMVQGRGGDVWTKPGSDGNTASVRLDKAMERKKPKGFADEVPHAHKETVPTQEISDGNYGNKNQNVTTYDDTGTPSANRIDTHIPISP